MELNKNFAAFTRKTEEFLFTMEKYLDEEGYERMNLELCVPGFPPLEEDVSGCPEEAMKTLMSAHLSRLDRPVKLIPRKKLLIVR